MGWRLLECVPPPPSRADGVPSSARGSEAPAPTGGGFVVCFRLCWATGMPVVTGYNSDRQRHLLLGR